MPHLLILSNLATEYQKLIRSAQLPDLTLFSTSDPVEALQYDEDFDLIFGEPSLLSQVIDKLPNIRWVQSTWAGIEPLLPACREKGIILTNVRGVYGPMMSEYVFGYLLAIERRILHRWQAQQSLIWDHSPTGTLQGKVMGLLGVGSIGAYLAGTARCFKMRVYGFTRHRQDCSDIERYFHPGELLDFAQALDYLVCTLPGTNQTRHLVNAAVLNALPKHAWVINIGRGSTIDENALINALGEGKIGGAVLDVFQNEPLAPDHPLWRTPNTFITAHTAALNYPPDIAAIFIENYRRYMNKERMIGLVNLEQGY